MSVRNRHSYKKIAVLGDAGVGKTSLCTRLTNKKFHPGYELTVGVHIHSYVVELTNCELDDCPHSSHRVLLYDVAGQPRFGDMLDVFIQGSMGILLVYDCSSILTFFSLEEIWLPFIKKHLPSIPIVIVASKIDQTDYMEVTDSQIEELMEKHKENFNFVGFAKTSAKIGLHINETICKIVEACIEHPNSYGPMKDIVPESNVITQSNPAERPKLLSDLTLSVNSSSILSRLEDDQETR